MYEEPDQFDASLIDTEQIEMLIEAGASESMELVRELLDLYEGESRQKLDDLKAHAATADYEAMGRSAHALAGSSANVGGKLVWKMAKQMENDCKEGRGETAAQAIQTLKATHDKTLIALRAFLDQAER